MLTKLISVYDDIFREYRYKPNILKEKEKFTLIKFVNKEKDLKELDFFYFIPKTLILFLQFNSNLLNV